MMIIVIGIGGAVIGVVVTKGIVKVHVPILCRHRTVLPSLVIGRVSSAAIPSAHTNQQEWKNGERRVDGQGVYLELTG